MIRFEMVCEMIRPDGSRVRVGSFPIPSTCLICGRPAVNADGILDANHITRNNQNGFACTHHPASGR